MSAARYEIIDQGCRVKIICPDGSVECFDPSTVGVPNLDDVAAGAIRQQARDIAELRTECDLLTHKVICCGVAATHSDADLSSTGAYASIWNSAQAESVRKLRVERDTLRARLAAIDAAPVVHCAWVVINGVNTYAQLIARPAKDSQSAFEETARSIGIRFNDIENHENQP